MIFTHLLSPLFALVISAPVLAQGQSQAPIVYDSVHNATVISGTWSSGSQGVLTGPGFANPANQSFTYPKTTGISYSFTDTYYEIARYRFNANGSEPTCITGVMNWVHGTYTLAPNGSIIMTPLGDGYQQIQDPCAAVSNFIEGYNDTELYQSWRIFQDPTTLGYKLHMFAFDGSPLPPQFLVSATPNMLPTQLLRNVSASHGSTTNAGLTTQNALKLSGAAQRSWSPKFAAGAVLGAFVVGLAGLAL